MAQQKGIIKLKGTIGDITFVQTKDGYIAKQRTSLNSARLATDPAFRRTRENNQEFGEATRAGKQLRDALRPFIKSAVDGRVLSRLMAVMSQIKNLDLTSVRGERNVFLGIQAPGAKNLLKGFNFNKNASLSTTLVKPFQVNLQTGQIAISNLIPLNDLRYPGGATHVALSGAWGRFNFGTGNSDVQYTNVVNLPVDGAFTNLALIPANVPAGNGTNLYLLKVDFYQAINGVQYPLSNGAYNAMAIVDMQ